MLGVIIHVIGDAINNIGVMVAAVVIWKVENKGRYYADPAASVFIAMVILLSAIPLVTNSGAILLQTAPIGVDLDHIKHDIEMASVDKLQPVKICADFFRSPALNRSMSCTSGVSISVNLSHLPTSSLMVEPSRASRTRRRSSWSVSTRTESTQLPCNRKSPFKKSPQQVLMPGLIRPPRWVAAEEAGTAVAN